MIINYQIMTESQKQDNGKYTPDFEALLLKAIGTEEEACIREVQTRGIGFAYNMVYIAQQACGHFEIFQTPQNKHYPLNEVLATAAENAATRNCTHCMCKY